MALMVRGKLFYFTVTKPIATAKGTSNKALLYKNRNCDKNQFSM